MAEAQVDHEIQMDRRYVTLSFAGLVAGFVMAAMFLGAAVGLVAVGHAIAGVALATLNLTGIATVFVHQVRHDD